MSQSSIRITLVAGPHCELESFALRSALEYYGAKVHMHWGGRPNDLVSVLSGENRGETDYMILSFHGEDGKSYCRNWDKTFMKKTSRVHVISVLKKFGRMQIYEGCMC